MFVFAIYTTYIHTYIHTYTMVLLLCNVLILKRHAMNECVYVLGWPLFSKVKNIEIRGLHIVSIDHGSATCGPWATCGPKIVFCGPLGADTSVRSSI